MSKLSYKQMEISNVIKNSTTKELHKRYYSLLDCSLKGNVKDLQQYIFEVNRIIRELENRLEKQKSVVKNPKYRLSIESQQYISNYLNDVIYLNTTDGNNLNDKSKSIIRRLQKSLEKGYLTRLMVIDFCNYFLGTKSLENSTDLDKGEKLLLKIEKRFNNQINL